MEQITTQSIILMQGPPASGKSTIARQYQEEHPETSVIVSRDSFRHARGKYWVPKQEKYITALEQFAIKEAAEMGFTVLVDATNMNPAMIADVVEIAKPLRIPVIGYMVHVPLETCIARDINKNREHTVGSTVIRSFYKKYEDYCRIHNLDRSETISIHSIYNLENATDNN